MCLPVHTYELVSGPRLEVLFSLPKRGHPFLGPSSVPLYLTPPTQEFRPHVLGGDMHPHVQNSPIFGTGSAVSYDDAKSILTRLLDRTPKRIGVEDPSPVVLQALKQFVDVCIDNDEFGFERNEHNSVRSSALRRVAQNFFEKINAFLLARDPDTYVCPRLLLFYAAAEKLGWTPFLFDSLDQIDVQGRLGVDVFNELIRAIRSTGRGKEFIKIERRDEKRLRLQFIRTVEMVNSLFDNVRSRILVVRLDLKFKKSLNGFLKSQDARKAIKRLIRNTKGKTTLFRYLLGYIWRHELSEADGNHFHVFLFFDGNHYRDGSHLSELIGKYWVASSTDGKGSYFSCNRPAYLKSLNYPAVGVIDYSDFRMRCNLARAIAYLFKNEQEVLAKPSKRAHRFGRSPLQMKRLHKSGRPRISSALQWDYLAYLDDPPHHRMS